MEKILDEVELSRIAAGLQREAQKIAEQRTAVWSPEMPAAAAAAWFFQVMKINPRKTGWNKRDRFFLAGRKMTPLWYVAMARTGYFPEEELKTTGQEKSRLKPTADRSALKGIEWSLQFGHGLAAAAGAAWLSQARAEKWRVYGYLPEEELSSGETWEAINWAGQRKLHKLTVLVTVKQKNNRLIAERFEGFNWHALPINGQSVAQVVDASKEAVVIGDKPTVIVADLSEG